MDDVSTFFSYRFLSCLSKRQLIVVALNCMLKDSFHCWTKDLSVLRDQREESGNSQSLKFYRHLSISRTCGRRC